MEITIKGTINEIIEVIDSIKEVYLYGDLKSRINRVSNDNSQCQETKSSVVFANNSLNDLSPDTHVSKINDLMDKDYEVKPKISLDEFRRLF